MPNSRVRGSFCQMDFADRLGGEQAGAEVAAQGLGGPFGVLADQRIVQAEAPPQAIHLFLAGVGAEDDACRVAGHQLDDQEHQQRYPPDHKEGGEDTLH